MRSPPKTHLRLTFRDGGAFLRRRNCVLAGRRGVVNTLDAIVPVKFVRCDFHGCSPVQTKNLPRVGRGLKIRVGGPYRERCDYRFKPRPDLGRLDETYYSFSRFSLCSPSCYRLPGDSVLRIQCITVLLTVKPADGGVQHAEVKLSAEGILHDVQHSFSVGGYPQDDLVELLKQFAGFSVDDTD